jgi:branched-chain amino acid transport system ATP-binding protein
MTRQPTPPIPGAPNIPSPGPSVGATLIETRGVCKNYGAFRALENVTIGVHQGEFVSIVGPNGAGKTTLLNLLTGLLLPSKGEVYFKGRNIAGAGPVTLATQGMARTFQLVQIFPELTVAETIAAAVVTRQGKRWRLLSPLLQDADIATRVAEIAGMFGLSSRLGTLSRLLSQGEKKLLDVASAFALEPQLILLDEPTSGVSTAEKHVVMKTLVGAARAADVEAIILVEHDMDLVASYSHRIIALAEGKVLADLPPDKFFADPVIIETVVGKRRGLRSRASHAERP